MVLPPISSTSVSYTAVPEGGGDGGVSNVFSVFHHRLLVCHCYIEQVSDIRKRSRGSGRLVAGERRERVRKSERGACHAG